MSSTVYNYAIIGAGAAGLNLALAMLEDPFFQDKRILILDKDDKSVNDKTWCFWEKGSGKWDKIISGSWDAALFASSEGPVQLDLRPYQYKMLHSLDFYQYAKTKIRSSKIIDWVEDDVLGILSTYPVQIAGKESRYEARHAFDSRIEPEFHANEDSYIRILQHFKGWIVETEENCFDPKRFVLMDFRLKWKDSTSFTYILPYSANKALVEFTLFTEQLIPEEDYDNLLKDYIDKIIGIKNYVVSHVEQGVIPMSDYPFHAKNSKLITKIGTAGSWVKPSTGYSFKNAERNSQKIISNIKSGSIPSEGIPAKKGRLYDSLFLEVLKEKNELGEELFTTMFTQNSPKLIFKFLDEQTTVPEDIQVMTSFNAIPFIKAIWRKVKGGI